MNENGMLQDGEISLSDLLEKLRGGWRVVVSGMALGIAGAVLAIFLIPPKYEAVAVVQVGQVGQVKVSGQPGATVQPVVTAQPVESPVQAVERMKTPAFQRRVAEALGDQKWLDTLVRTGATQDLSLQIIKATAGPEQIPLIELRGSSENPETALKKTVAAIAQLIKVHDELAKPALNHMRTDLAITREKLASAERDLGALNKLVAAAGIKDERFTQLALMSSLKVQKEAETFSYRQMIMALETALGAPATQTAKAIEEVFIMDKPVSPKKTLLLALGAIGGLLIGVGGMLGMESLQRVRKQRAVRTN